VESFTIAPCVLSDGTFVPNLKCSDDLGKASCSTAKGKCQLDQDGYYIVCAICLAFGVTSLVFYIRPMVRKLESIPSAQWKLKSKNK
jgi:hypothetical protein